MSYTDPYTSHDRYTDDEFNPYTSTHHAHPSYDQSGTGYRDYSGYGTDTGAGGSPGQGAQHSFNGNPSKELPAISTTRVRDADEVSGFDKGEFSAHPGKGFKSIRTYYNENMWTKGSRVSCIGRFCCCTILITLFLFISILLSLVLWIRPPDLTFVNAGFANSGHDIQILSDGAALNFAFNFTFNNPNYFPITLTTVDIELSYPINGNSISVGGGNLSNINFPAHEISNVTFPFTFAYHLSNDPGEAGLLDLIARCSTSPPSNLNLSYQLTVGVRILLITVTPVISNSISFQCPLSQSAIEQLKNLLQGGGTPS